MAFLAPFFVGTAGTAGGAAATSGIIGTGGAVTAGGVASAAAAVGAGLSAASSIQQGRAANAAAKFNAQLAGMQGQVNEGRLQREARRDIGTLRARVAKTGARMEGTPLMVLAESEADAELDLLDQRWSTQQTASTYRRSGRQSQREGYYRAGTSLLTGVGNMF